jgi:hypothetical protein
MLRVSVFAAAALLAVAGHVNAGTVYSNGPLNGNANAYIIGGGQSISDSFSVSSPTNLVGAQVGVWVSPGAAPVSLHWSIGTSALGSDVSSGISNLTNTFAFTNSTHFNVFESTFPLNGAVAPGNTYWLTISFGSTTTSSVLS